MIVAFFFPFYSLQHFLSFFFFALLHWLGIPIKRLIEAIFNLLLISKRRFSTLSIVFALESGSFTRLRKHTSIPKGLLFFFLNHARELLDWRIPTAPGTEAPTLRAHPDHSSMDLFISMFVCNHYNKLVILF